MISCDGSQKWRQRPIFTRINTGAYRLVSPLLHRMQIKFYHIRCRAIELLVTSYSSSCQQYHWFYSKLDAVLKIFAFLARLFFTYLLIYCLRLSSSECFSYIDSHLIADLRVALTLILNLSHFISLLFDVSREIIYTILYSWSVARQLIDLGHSFILMRPWP